MSKQKEKRPAYFRFFVECCDLLSLLDDEQAGRVIHAVSNYFRDLKEPEGLDTKEKIVFDRLQRDVDQSYADYEAAVQSGKQGWKKNPRNKNKDYEDPFQ